MFEIKMLTNVEIQEALLIKDYFQIFFTNSWILNIYNNFSTSGGNVKLLEGSKFVRIQENEAILFYSSNGIIMNVDMTDKGYNGPEAMGLFKGDDHEIIIWS